MKSTNLSDQRIKEIILVWGYCRHQAKTETVNRQVETQYRKIKKKIVTAYFWKTIQDKFFFIISESFKAIIWKTNQKVKKKTNESPRIGQLFSQIGPELFSGFHKKKYFSKTNKNLFLSLCNVKQGTYVT